MARGKPAVRGASSQRQLRVGEEIRHALAEVLARGDILDPDVRDIAITVTEVTISPDLRNATAFVIPLGGRNSEKVLAGLNRCAGWLRGQTSRMVRLKFSPKLGFELDRSFETADRVDSILRSGRVVRDLAHDDADDGTAEESGGGGR